MKLTPAQEEMVKRALGNGGDWPYLTSDPRVNHRVDQLIQGKDEVPDWEDLSEEERQFYIEEVAVYEE